MGAPKDERTTKVPFFAGDAVAKPKSIKTGVRAGIENTNKRKPRTGIRAGIESIRKNG